MNAKLTLEEVKELMRALGFHTIPSRNRWKMKLSDCIVVTDVQLRDANDRGELPEFLMKYLDEKATGLNILLRRKKMLSSFFK